MDNVRSNWVLSIQFRWRKCNDRCQILRCISVDHLLAISSGLQFSFFGAGGEFWCSDEWSTRSRNMFHFTNGRNFSHSVHHSLRELERSWSNQGLFFLWFVANLLNMKRFVQIFTCFPLVQANDGIDILLAVTEEPVHQSYLPVNADLAPNVSLLVRIRDLFDCTTEYFPPPIQMLLNMSTLTNSIDTEPAANSWIHLLHHPDPHRVAPLMHSLIQIFDRVDLEGHRTISSLHDGQTDPSAGVSHRSNPYVDFRHYLVSIITNWPIVDRNHLALQSALLSRLTRKTHQLTRETIVNRSQRLLGWIWDDSCVFRFSHPTDVFNPPSFNLRWSLISRTQIFVSSLDTFYNAPQMFSR